MTYKSCNEECRKEAERPKKYSSPMLCIAIYIAVASLVCPVAMAGDVTVPEDDFNLYKLCCEDSLSQQSQQDKYEAPMRWIGIYIAAASLFCSVAMAGDVFRGIRRKKLWFPCKFFTVNAASLTVLAVATKLPVDLTSSMDGKDSKLISIIITLPVFSCFYYCKRLKEKLICGSSASTDHGSSEQGISSPELDLNDYVLLLEGEANLPNRILKNMCLQMNKEICKGQNLRPKNLKELLSKSRSNFKGVADFDISQVSNCWTLPVVTLTTIAIALPNIENHRVDGLISSVSEGLSYANLVEESFSSKGDDVLNMKRAADVAWRSIELYRKWLNKDLRKLPLKGISVEETLQTLLDVAEKAAIEFLKDVTGGPKVLAANSMCRITQTILKDYGGNEDAHTDGSLFEQLSIMIADILGACLSNLSRVIIRKCYCSAIEEREKSVKHAARLVGETKEILEILEHHQLPSLSGDRAPYIDEWRAVMMQKDTPSIVSPPENETAASSSSELHIDVDE